MLKRMAPGRTRECLAAATKSPRSNPRVEYPSWYLQRWHFLPEGYLSRRSAAAYDSVIRRVYHFPGHASQLGRLVTLMRPAPGHILELGCGTGISVAALAEAFPGARVTGVDLSPFMLERAERRNRDKPQADLVHADGAHLPWPDGGFDAVVACHFFGHLPEAARNAAALEAVRVLAPGGRLYTLEHAWHAPLHGLPTVSRSRFAMGATILTAYEPHRTVAASNEASALHQEVPV